VVARQDTDILTLDEIIRTDRTRKAVVGIIVLALTLRVWSWFRWTGNDSILISMNSGPIFLSGPMVFPFNSCCFPTIGSVCGCGNTKLDVPRSLLILLLPEFDDWDGFKHRPCNSSRSALPRSSEYVSWTISFRVPVRSHGAR